MKTTIAIIAVILLGWGAYALMNREEAAPVLEENAGTSAIEETQIPDTSTTPSIKEFVVVGKPFSFNPATIKVNKGDTVRIVFQNEQGVHDWVIDEFNARTKVLQQAGQSETVEFMADKSGTFEYYCSVGTHRQMGMKGSLIVE